MSKKAFGKSKSMTDGQVSADIRRMMNDIGDAGRAGGRLQFFWRIELATGIAASRIASLFYGKGVKASVPEYFAIQAGWEQSRLQDDITATREELNALRGRV